MSQNKHPRLLLINPWIYDFTAYDLWSQPLGLLYMASFLRKQGFCIAWFDCLSKYSPSQSPPKIRRYGTGHYTRTIIEKPELLNHIPRSYARYGVPEQDFVSFLEEQKNVTAVLVTSLMTYWYPGVKRVVELVRTYLPDVPVILGGVYATLLPEHAKREVQPDYIIKGPGERASLELLSGLAGIPFDENNLPSGLDDRPRPAFDLLNHPDYLVIMTSRGCPYDCSFCAQRLISMPFTQRSVDSVLDEFSEHYRRFRLRDFAFYDDALFIRKEKHIKPILEGLIRRRTALRLHSPNGLFAREIDTELAGLMFASGFKTIRLSFETSSETRRRDMYSKVCNDDMVKAVERLEKAGYRRADLEAYVMMGLPGQDPEEVIASIIFVNSLSVKVRLASFSPIHGTVEFRRAVNNGLLEEDVDPLLTNKTIFPLQHSERGYETYRKLRIFTQVLNDAASRGLAMFSDADIGSAVRNVTGQL